MNKFIILILLFSFTQLVRGQTEHDIPPEVEIPRNLEEAHAQLMKLFPKEEIERITQMASEDEMSIYHFGAGMGIRNSWGLWHGSRLAKYFNDLGIKHADDMSGIILGTFWCRIHEQPFRLQERIEYYQAYWRATVRPPESTTTPGGHEIDFRQSWLDEDSNGVPSAVHIGRCDHDGSFWAYEWNKGVYAPTGEMLKTIMEDDMWRMRELEMQVRPILDQVELPIMAFTRANAMSVVEYLNQHIGKEVGLQFISEVDPSHGPFTCNLKKIAGYDALMYFTDCSNLAWTYETNRIVIRNKD